MPADSKSKPQARFRIILLKSTAEVDFGLQKGKGVPYQTVQKQRSSGQDLSFEFEAGIGKTAEGDPDLNGDFVQGPKGGRFVYINIGASAGQISSQWNRRLKIPLNGFVWKQLEDAAANSKLVFETRVPGTGRDGGPNCATVKPFDGWRIIGS